ncbi:uncharacterized protein LOC114159423 [Xiphophorus couchianus]|uniref:uncharacterized protein LOC114159423 n=1 Tax=Xiphophorus couchianus TaxID=32473 RepID=UPI0010169A05|nr:uncharacterized protein LOC114159423 [Xiphophorus couchianus]
METKSASLKTRSYASMSSTRSSGTATSAAAAKARANAEAAKARLVFAEKEMKLKMEKARLEASMEMLTIEKETAAAIAKAEALEAVVGASEGKHSCRLPFISSVVDSSERTKEYVKNQAKLSTDMHVESHDAPCLQSQRLPLEQPSHNTLYMPHLTPPRDDCTAVANIFKTQQKSLNPFITMYVNATSSQEMEHQYRTITESDQDSVMPAHSPTVNQQPCDTNNAMEARPTSQRGNFQQPAHSTGSQMTDFVRFLARRELVTTGLLQFNDRPENYRAWRRSFQNAIRDLNLTCDEEMDLLVKWLGSESTEHAKRIRSIHINQPAKGLNMIWNRLDVSYGASEAIEKALFERLDRFPKIGNKDHTKLQDLSDLLMELDAAKTEGDLPGLSYLDTPRGVHAVAQKLPYSIQEKWLSHGSSYKQLHCVPFPPFSVFVSFIYNQAQIRNDPSFNFVCQDEVKVNIQRPPWKNRTREISVHKTEVSAAACSDNKYKKNMEDPDRRCPIHNKPHTLQKCRTFREKPLEERKTFLKENGICFKCCNSSAHTARDCQTIVKCTECTSDRHSSALHPGQAPWVKDIQPPIKHGGEPEPIQTSEVTSQCTSVCGEDRAVKNCSKICLARVYPKGESDKAIKAYVIIDEQSNRSLAHSSFFDTFGVQGPAASYSLKTCSGMSENMGRVASDFCIESMDGKTVQLLPSLLECNEIPDNRAEIPTPSAALYHEHLKPIVHLIPELEPDVPIMLLLGRDIIRLHKVHKCINGPPEAPYAQKLALGWVIVGKVCLGRVHKPLSVNTYFTNILEQARTTIFEPCPSVLHVKERYSPKRSKDVNEVEDFELGRTVFQLTSEDNKQASSFEDLAFMAIMKQGVKKDASNSWVAPLPFRQPRQHLPDNRQQTIRRFHSLKHNLERKPEMSQHFFSFMEKIFENGHAEVAPLLNLNQERWYLPIFGVYHPKKPGNIRVVFDSSAQHQGVSLNDVLLKGPDLNNLLLGVLMRFRKEAIAITADIKQMFHSFLVREEDRNFLRFFWFKDNDPTQEVIEYRMTVHVFGNSPSPAVAIYCLRQAAMEGEPHHDPGVKDFVNRDFYVDDALKSFSTVKGAVSLLKNTQDVLANSNLRLHKIASNNKEVMEAFPAEDRANDLKDLDLSSDVLPEQRSLGLNWNLESDAFVFKIDQVEKPFTRRGVLSVVNSVYDPLGFVAPVTIQGKYILRELTQQRVDWDSRLPDMMEEQWMIWRDSLQDLSSLKIPRPYTEVSLSTAKTRELCVFLDASTKAIAAVAYLKVVNEAGNIQTGFVMGKAKLAPRPEHTVPRLELCAAVLAVELADFISSELDVYVDATTFYTDSKVVLGYINNETRCFYVYVSNRVVRIRRSSHPKQWKYVSTVENPADCATRSVPAAFLSNTSWLRGPSFLTEPRQESLEQGSFELVEPNVDVEVRPQISTLKTQASLTLLGSHRFSKFSTWQALRRAIATLLHVAISFHTVTENRQCKRWHLCQKAGTPDQLNLSEDVIIRTVQEEAYAEELACLKNGQVISRRSPLKALDPFIDEHNILRVGGRMRHGEISLEEKHPKIIPGKTHIATLLVRYYHEQTLHQGRHFTEGAIRVAGIWIIGLKRLVGNVIYHCVTCRKLRGVPPQQKMADLPADRLSMDPPFTYIGLDVFGPWNVVARRTRGGLAHSKRWALIFTCMAVRAVHIEVIESLDTSCFINALRRFLAIRGPVKQIRSDRGTNFVSASADLRIPSNIDSKSVEKYLADRGCSWVFNPPHASHMGGSWERLIGIARRILDSMFLQVGTSSLTHEVLTTLMAEVVAIINSRPLLPVSTDPSDPVILTPATLLTQKTGVPSVPPEDPNVKDLCKQQWRQVQHLAQTFWSKWRRQYLSTLQPRRKWHDNQTNLETGSIVLLRDQQLKRNEWPLGIITQVLPSQDNKVRKAEVKVSRQDGTKVFLRPVTELILLLSPP